MRPVPRAFVLLAALVVAVDLFNGAVVPLGLPPIATAVLGLCIGAGAAFMLTRATAPGSATPPDPDHDAR